MFTEPIESSQKKKIEAMLKINTDWMHGIFFFYSNFFVRGKSRVWTASPVKSQVRNELFRLRCFCALLQAVQKLQQYFKFGSIAKEGK